MTTETALTIFGKKIVLKNQFEKDTLSSEYIECIQTKLEDNFRELSTKNPNLKREEILVLLCINLMDQLLYESNQRSELSDQELTRRTSQLISLIDVGMTADRI